MRRERSGLTAATRPRSGPHAGTHTAADPGLRLDSPDPIPSGGSPTSRSPSFRGTQHIARCRVRPAPARGTVGSVVGSSCPPGMLERRWVGRVTSVIGTSARRCRFASKPDDQRTLGASRAMSRPQPGHRPRRRSRLERSRAASGRTRLTRAISAIAINHQLSMPGSCRAHGRASIAGAARTLRSHASQLPADGYQHATRMGGCRVGHDVTGRALTQLGTRGGRAVVLGDALSPGKPFARRHGRMRLRGLNRAATDSACGRDAHQWLYRRYTAGSRLDRNRTNRAASDASPTHASSDSG